MKNIATDIYTFDELIKNDCLYIDKTKSIYSLVKRTGSKQYFLSRPRRFGKSLLLSTIQCIFEGKRELFKGLYIDSADFDWQKYPVIRLDMNSSVANSADLTIARVNNLIKSEINRLNVEVDMLSDPVQNFNNLVIKAAQKSLYNQVVLLIDEYDKPLLDHLGSKDVLPFQRFLKQFYGVVKSTESLQRFSLMTGVSKFSKVSIFSDLNNLVDITMSPQFSDICGFTHAEVQHYFSDHIQALAETNNTTADEAFSTMCKMYDGYLFCNRGKRMFNPVSVGRCLTDKEFGLYWFETGTPGGLMNYLKTHPMDLSKYVISQSKLGAYDPENPGIVPLLFQTGYLTIESVKGVEPALLYVLNFPNTEVQYAFNSWLAVAYIDRGDPNSARSENLSALCLESLNNANVDEFIDLVKQMFSAIPYEMLDNKNEHQYHALFHTMLYITASNINSQVQTNLGRVDSVVETGDYIYVIEFKYDMSAEEALNTIKDKDYYKRYLNQGKQVILLGINFSEEMRNIASYAYEQV